MGVRILESPSVAWAAQENDRVQRGQRRNVAEPFSGKRLGVSIVDGIARVDESLTMLVETRDQGQVPVPLWHVFVHDLGFRDITPADEPPAVPLPSAKPYRAQERARLAQSVPTRQLIRRVAAPA